MRGRERGRERGAVTMRKRAHDRTHYYHMTNKSHAGPGATFGRVATMWRKREATLSVQNLTYPASAASQLSEYAVCVSRCGFVLEAFMHCNVGPY